jgi:hypothetical protein
MDMNETPEQLDEQPQTSEQQCEAMLLQWGLASQHGELELSDMPDVRAKRSMLQNLLGGGKKSAPKPKPAPVAAASVAVPVHAPPAAVAKNPVPVPAAPAKPKASALATPSGEAGPWFAQQPTWMKMATGALAATIVFVIILLSRGNATPEMPAMSANPNSEPAAVSMETLKTSIAAQERKIKKLTVAANFRAGVLNERTKKIEELQGNLNAAQAKLTKEIKTLAAVQTKLKRVQTDSGNDKLTLMAMTRVYETSCKKQVELQSQIKKLKTANTIVANAMGEKPKGSNVANLDEVVDAKVAQATKALNAQLATLTEKNITLAAAIGDWTKKQAVWDAREKMLLASTAGANAAELKTTIASWQTKLAKAELAQTAAEKSKTDLETQLTNTKNQLAQSKSFRDELDAEIAAMIADKNTADTHKVALQGKLDAQIDENRKTQASLAALKKTATGSGTTNAELAALKNKLATQTATLATAQAQVSASQVASQKLLDRMLLLYMGPPQTGVSRLAMLQQAIKRNRLAARGQSLKVALKLQPQMVVTKVDALLTQMALLDGGDLRAVTRFRDTLAKSDIESQMVALASTKTAEPALVAYLTEAQLIFAAIATA